MFDAPRILRFLKQSLEAGQKACLVTVTDVTGASVRNPGAQMAVAQDGSSLGSLSGGCIEKAVVAEALKAIEAGLPHKIAYGAGTPIIDIRLPCGGRVDLLFTPLDAPEIIATLFDLLDRRVAASLRLPTRGSSGAITINHDQETGWDDGSFTVRYHPPLHLIIAGHGGTVEALMRQARALDITCMIATPDADIAASLAGGAAQLRQLAHIGEPLGLPLDRWSAAGFFFHDHDWEVHLLAEVLASDAFYIGAMGSKVTHQNRLALLRQAGVGDDQLNRITAPIGVIPSSRDPETLALSALTQIVDRYNGLIGARSNPAAPTG